MESLFDELVMMATNERLDNILNKDKGFLEVQKRQQEQLSYLKNWN